MADSVIEVLLRAITGEFNANVEESGDVVAASTGGMLDSLRRLLVGSKETEAGSTASFAHIAESAQETALSVKESMTEATEKVVEFGEAAQLTSLKSASAFGAISAILGGGLIVGVLGEMLNKVKENEIEMEHMSQRTGATFEQIAQLKAIMQEFGFSGDSADRTLRGLSRSMEAAISGSQKQKDAFAEMGISVDFLKANENDLMAIILKMSDHLSESSNKTRDNASATTLLTRAGFDLVAVLRQGPEALREAIERTKEMVQAQKDALESAKAFETQEIALGRQLKTIGAEVLPMIVTAIKNMMQAWAGAITIIRGAGETMEYFATVAGITLPAAAKAGALAIKGDIAGAALEMQTAANKAAIQTHLYLEQIRMESETLGARIKQIWAEPLPEQKGGGGEDADRVGKFDALRLAELSAQRKHAAALIEIDRERIKTTLDIFSEADRHKAEMQTDETTRAVMLANVPVLATIRANAAMKSLDEQALAMEINFLDQEAALFNAKDPKQAAQRERVLAEKQALEDRFRLEELKREETLAKEKNKIADTVTVQQRKMLDEMAKSAEANAAAIAKIDQKRYAELTKARELDEKAFEDSEHKKFELERSRIEESFKLGQINVEQRLNQLKASYDREHALDVARLNDKIRMAALDPTNPQELAKLNEKKLAMEAKYNADVLKLDQTAAEQRKKVWDQWTTQIGRAFDQTINGMIRGQTTFLQGMMKLGDQLLSDFVSHLVQMGMKWAEQKAMDLAVHFGFIAATKSADTAADAATIAEGAATRATEVTGAAAVAFANTFASIAAIPIVGPEIAPGAAAGAMAAVLSVLPMATAAKGGVFSQDMLTMVHAKEMILPPAQSQGLQQMIANSNSRTANATLNYHAAPGGGSDQRKAAREMAGMINRIARSGALG